MRPVKKECVGETIKLFESVGDMETTDHIIQVEYKPYQNARKVLLANLGNYCSYCEGYYANGSDLQTEHIQPKGLKDDSGRLLYDHLQYKWSNFLLGCATCNGKGNKGTKDVRFEDVHLPHLNNTFLSLEYREAGVVVVNPNLVGLSKQNATNLIQLVGLDKPSSETDYRCDVRRQTWDKAQKLLKQYQGGEVLLDKLVAYIKEQPCWSIWYTVFSGYDEVRQKLLEFPGTCKECFDENNHYNPINRNPGKKDPI
ncbi:MAG: hypothetical protein K2L76_00320 [Muribaculaceae bacterium]|nr:hypothetical protein [Muribaculaceae bacterium]